MLTQLRRVVLLVVPIVALTLGGCGVFGETEGRGPVSLEGWEAIQVGPTRLSVEVPSCNGDPVLDQLIEEDGEVRIRVVTDLPGPGPQDACLDVVEVRLAAPLAGRRLFDAVSGAQIPVRD